MSEIKENDKMLQPFVDTRIELITRFERRSEALVDEVEEIEIVDSPTLKSALAKRKEITAHIKEVADTRLSITREFDAVKTQFTNAEKRVVEPAAKAKVSIGNKILQYEDEVARIAKEEADRVQAIVDTFATNTRSFRTIKSVDERGAELKDLYAKLPEADQKNQSIKLAFTEIVVSLSERKEDIRTAEVSEADAAKAAAKRRRQVALAEEEAAEAAKIADKKSKSAPKTGIKMVTKFNIVDPLEVPFEYCVPSDQLIRKAIADGVRNIPGVEIREERSF